MFRDDPNPVLDSSTGLRLSDLRGPEHAIELIDKISRARSKLWDVVLTSNDAAAVAEAKARHARLKRTRTKLLMALQRFRGFERHLTTAAVLHLDKATLDLLMQRVERQRKGMPWRLRTVT